MIDRVAAGATTWGAVERVGDATVLDELEWQAQPRHVQALVGRLLRAGLLTIDGRTLESRDAGEWDLTIQDAIEEGEQIGYERGYDVGFDEGSMAPLCPGCSVRATA